MSELIHEKENNSISEMFLMDNKEKFTKDHIVVLKLLYSVPGRRYTGKEVCDITGQAAGDRRLRHIFANRKDCMKAPRYKANGKLEGMEYWLNIPMPKTKEQAIAEGQKLLDAMQDKFKQGELF